MHKIIKFIPLFFYLSNQFTDPPLPYADSFNILFVKAILFFTQNVKIWACLVHGFRANLFHLNFLVVLFFPTLLSPVKLPISHVEGPINGFQP